MHEAPVGSLTAYPERRPVLPLVTAPFPRAILADWPFLETKQKEYCGYHSVQQSLKWSNQLKSQGWMVGEVSKAV